MHSYYFSTQNILIVSMLYMNACNAYTTENSHSENESGNDEKSVSLESESNEVFNSTSKENPIRLRNEEENNIFSDSSTKYLTNCNDGTKPKELVTRDFSYKTHYSYIVSIQKKGSHYSTGALIDKKWILTAAEQFYNIRESIKLLKVRLGSVNCKKGGTLVPIKEIVIHPDYVYREPKYDVALLRIAHPIKFSELIKPINVSTVKGQIKRAKFLTNYWPRLIINNQYLPNTAKERIKQNSLRVSMQKMIPEEKCFHRLQKYSFSLDRTSQCLEPIVSHHSPCTPDAGAPIIADDGLWGITSGWTSEDCLKNPTPTIFTRISLPPTKSWLESLLK